MQHPTSRAAASLALAGAALSLNACAAMDKIDEMQLARDREGCVKFGFTPGTDPFAQCMQRTAIERQRSYDAQDRALKAAAEKKP